MGATVGNLNIEVQLSLAKISAQFDQLNAIVKRSSANTHSSFDKLPGLADHFALSLTGIHSIFRKISEVAKEVYTDIDNIPGVSEGTIESIHRMKYALEGNNSVLKQSIADLEGHFANIGTGIGFLAGAAVYGMDNANTAFASFNAEAENFARKDFDKKMAALVDQFNKLALVSKGAMVNSLREEAAALDKASEAGGTLAEKEAQRLEAEKKRIEAQRTLNELIGQTTTRVNVNSASAEKARVATMGDADAIKYLSDKMKDLKNQAGGVNPLFWTAKDTAAHPEQAEKMELLAKQYNDTQIELGKRLRDNGKWVNDLGQAFSTAFEDGILGGDKLSDVFDNLAKSILSMALKLMIINPLLNSLFKGSTGWSSLPSFFAGSLGTSTGNVSLAGSGGLGGMYADGGSPPVGKASIVGENGPELFVPGVAGNIIPNDALRGSGGATVYNIDARGADRTGLSRLESMIRETRAMIKPTSLAAATDARRRVAA